MMVLAVLFLLLSTSLYSSIGNQISRFQSHVAVEVVTSSLAELAGAHENRPRALRGEILEWESRVPVCNCPAAFIDFAFYDLWFTTPESANPR